MAKRKTRNVGDAFCSSLFMECFENTVEIKNVSDNKNDKYYHIGEIVSFDNVDFCIIGISYDESTIE